MTHDLPPEERIPTCNQKSAPLLTLFQRNVPAQPTSDGAGVKPARSPGTPALDYLDPFLMLDEFKSDTGTDYIAGFPDHPHRGFETMTYMLAGAMRHCDHKGNEGNPRPGSIQWMTAGRGIIHSEMPQQQDGLMWGFQLWVNLPAAQKMTAPRYQDIPPDMVRLSLVNLYLHGFTDPHIHEYDTLTSEERWNEFADIILANPPFMSPKGGIKSHKWFSIQAKRSEVLFVDYMAEHLTPIGRAGIIVPEGIIFQSQTAYKDLRKMLVENSLVVVSLPAGCFNPYSGVKTSILILDKPLARQSDTIAFFKVENDGFGLGAQCHAFDKNDLPQVKAELDAYLHALRSGDLRAKGPTLSQLSQDESNTGIDAVQLLAYTTSKCLMRYVFPPRYWTAIPTVVAMLTFVVGTSVACLQKGVGNGQIAQACCKGHCRHDMAEVQAVKCCQRHQHHVAQAVPLSLSVKPALSATALLSVAVLSFPINVPPMSARAFLSPPRHPPPTSALYTFHCSLVI